MILETLSPSSAFIVIHTIKDQRFKTAEAVLLQAQDFINYYEFRHITHGIRHSTYE